MDKEKFLKSRTEWKNFHSAILFSMLNPNHGTSSPDVLKDFLDFVKMPEKARDSFLADFDFLEFSTNNRQTILLIKNKEYDILIENNLDCCKVVSRNRNQRNYTSTIPRVNTCKLNVLHNSQNVNMSSSLQIRAGSLRFVACPPPLQAGTPRNVQHHQLKEPAI